MLHFSPLLLFHGWQVLDVDETCFYMHQQVYEHLEASANAIAQAHHHQINDDIATASTTIVQHST